MVLYIPVNRFDLARWTLVAGLAIPALRTASLTAR
jgi:hypothetical protein